MRAFPSLLHDQRRFLPPIQALSALIGPFTCGFPLFLTQRLHVAGQRLYALERGGPQICGRVGDHEVQNGGELQQAQLNSFVDDAGPLLWRREVFQLLLQLSVCPKDPYLAEQTHKYACYIWLIRGLIQRQTLVQFITHRTQNIDYMDTFYYLTGQVGFAGIQQDAAESLGFSDCLRVINGESSQNKEGPLRDDVEEVHPSPHPCHIAIISLLIKFIYATSPQLFFTKIEAECLSRLLASYSLILGQFSKSYLHSLHRQSAIIHL